jgi:hypothetical protein
VCPYYLLLYVLARIVTVHESRESWNDFGIPGSTAIVGPPMSAGKPGAAGKDRSAFNEVKQGCWAEGLDRPIAAKSHVVQSESVYTGWEIIYADRDL